MLRGIRSLLGESRHRNAGAKGDDEKNRFHSHSPGSSAAGCLPDGEQQV
jgi:hypothetical protein